MEVKNRYFLIWVVIVLSFLFLVGCLDNKVESFENSKLTVIITASYIKSHPSTKYISDVIDSLEMINLPEGTRIILAHDYKKDANYEKYLRNLENKYSDRKDIIINVRKTKGHLTGNVRDALKHVKTEFILLLQHDLPFVRNVDISRVMEDMKDAPELKHVRFNRRKTTKTAFDDINNLFGLEKKQRNYTYTRTPGWSDQNHIARTDYYDDIVMKECSDGGFMEGTLQGKNEDENSHKKYGTYIFGGLEHEQMIEHTDGRNSS